MAEEVREQLVIEDSFIHKMLGNRAYLAAFPFLKKHAEAAKASGSSCNSCNSRKRGAGVDYAEIKRTLAAMPAASQAALLKLANARSVRLVFRNGKNEVVRLTIQASPPA